MSKNDKRMPVSKAIAVAAEVSEVLKMEGVRHEICGSLRRGTKPDAGDIDVVVSDLPKALDALLPFGSGSMPKPRKGKPARMASVDLNAGIRVSLYFAYPEEWGAMVLFLSGNHIFNIQMRAVAKAQGLKLNQYGLWEMDNAIAGRDERQIFQALGIGWMEPNEREFHPKFNNRFKLREGT